MIQNGPIRLDVDEYRAWVGGQQIHLSAAAFQLLQLLMQNVDRIVSHEAVYRASRMGPVPMDPFDRLDSIATASITRSYIKLVRRGLGHDDWVESVRGVGYRLVRLE